MTTNWTKESIHSLASLSLRFITTIINQAVIYVQFQAVEIFLSNHCYMTRTFQFLNMKESVKCQKTSIRVCCNVDTMPMLKKMKTNLKSKITFFETNWHQVREASELTPKVKLHVPMRRNQKLSDKVTTLQKLVSPFGKTGTASVLQEGSLHIKFLHAQIQALIQMLSFTYNRTVKAHYTQVSHQECGDKLQVDLRNRGLLVPISITHKVTMEEQIHHTSASRIMSS